MEANQCVNRNLKGSRCRRYGILSGFGFLLCQAKLFVAFALFGLMQFLSIVLVDLCELFASIGVRKASQLELARISCMFYFSQICKSFPIYTRSKYMARIEGQ
jgi:uncharacterized membrane protein YqjE